MGKRRYDFALVDISAEGKRLDGAGGQIWAVRAGTQTWAETFRHGSASSSGASNGIGPIALENGGAKFAVDDDVLAVDVFGIAPTGHSFQALGIKGGFANLGIDLTRRYGQSIVIPFDCGQTAKWTIGGATDSGIRLPRRCALGGNHPTLNVIEVDAGETIQAGTVGDSDGLLPSTSLANVGLARAAASAITSVANADNVAVEVTISAGSDTGRGYITIPYAIPGVVG